MKGINVTRKLSQFVTEVEFEDIPGEVVKQAKDYILDCIGCAFGSYGVPEGILISKLGKEFGIGNEGTILPNGQKASIAAAAFVNCKLSNFIDADETLYNYYHIGGVPFFSAFHAAEKVGASGKELITAVVLGYEIAYRFCNSYPFLTVGENGQTEYAKSSGYGFNCIAGAVAAAKILRLDLDGIENAMGISGYYAPLPLNLKWLYTKSFGIQKSQDFGWFAFVGLIAALFAQEGYSGDRGIFDDLGEYSFWQAFGMPGFDFDGLVKDLGVYWGIMEMGIKPYPCCRWFHTPIFMVKTILEKESIEVSEVNSILLKVHPAMANSDFFLKLSRWDEWPIKDAVHSQFSCGYCLACALNDIPPGPLWQEPETLQNPSLAEFSKRLEITKDEKCEQKMLTYLASDKPKGKLMAQVHYTVEVRSTKGNYIDTAEYIYGDSYDPEHKLSRNELRQKFVDNCSISSSKEKIEQLIDSVYTIESFRSINEFSRLFL